MLTSRSVLVRRVLASLDASPSRIPVLLGGCGSGRTTLLHQLRERIGRTAAQRIDIERTATTPERFFQAVVAESPFPPIESPAESPRAAFESALAFFSRLRPGGPGSGEPATFLLDEFLELRTFESFPGLRSVLRDLVDGLAASPNRFVLTSRYPTRALRLLTDRSSRFEVIHMPALTVEEAFDIVGPLGGEAEAEHQDAEYLARTVLALGDGRPMYVQAIADALAATREHRSAGGAGGNDPISALAGLMAAEGRIQRHCHFSYELRLHRARGYGALKAILDILAEDEGLTLTEISQRLHRTPGSTKDYLSWLEDVDLVSVHHKRYSFTDPLLRVWVRLHCRASAATDDDMAREIRKYALPRLPQLPQPPQTQPTEEPVYAMAASAAGSSGIIEID